MPAPTGTTEHPPPVARVPVRVIVPVLGALVVLVVLLVTALEPLRVTSQSMSPTLDSGDQVLVDKLTGRWRAPAVGDVVVFRDPVGDALVVKRVVALAGQTVGLEDGELVVDSTVRHEPQVDVSRIDSTYFGPVTGATGCRVRARGQPRRVDRLAHLRADPGRRPRRPRGPDLLNDRPDAVRGRRAGGVGGGSRRARRKPKGMSKNRPTL